MGVKYVDLSGKVSLVFYVILICRHRSIGATCERLQVLVHEFVIFLSVTVYAHL